MTKIRKAKETMSAKERVLRTFAFEKTDRVPIDYATNGSIHHRLCVELGIPGDNYDLLLEALGFSPLLTAGMCLGEGTGGALGALLLDQALAAYTDVVGIEDIGRKK